MRQAALAGIGDHPIAIEWDVPELYTGFALFARKKVKCASAANAADEDRARHNTSGGQGI
jgi:hypothetical protein